MVHDGPNGSLGDAVECVHVRWARPMVDELLVDEFVELLGEEFTRVVSLRYAGSELPLEINALSPAT